MNKVPSIAEIQDFFVSASLKGFAGGAEPEKSDKPGYKIIRVSKRHFTYEDEWCVTPYSKSSGKTTVWYENNVVMTMQYAGYYPEVALPFLKEALMYTYTRSQWNNGRGPRLFITQNSNLVYENIPRNSDKMLPHVILTEEYIHDQVENIIVGSHFFQIMFA